MTTTIRSNGSKWLGDRPDDLDALIDRLRNYTLAGWYNGYEKTCGGSIRFWGNFDHLSAVFDIETDEPTLIRKLKALYRENRKRPDYFKPAPLPKLRRLSSHLPQ